MKNTKQLSLFGLATVVLGAAAACQTADNRNATANSPTNIAVVTGNTPAPVNAPASAPATTTSATTAAAGSPTAAYEAAYAARKNKDVAGLKGLLSKDIIEFFTAVAQDEKKTLDQVIKELCDKPQASTSQVRNEKIDGEYATVEYFDENGKWKTMDFIKEGGSWKLTVPRFDKDQLEAETKKK